METIPRNAKIGGALGFLGGLIAMICIAMYFVPEESTLIDMGVYMLIAIMFFALAGGLARTGQWSWEVLLLMSFLTIGVVGAAVVFGAVDLYIGILLVIIGALITVNVAMPSSKTWADRMRF